MILIYINCIDDFGDGQKMCKLDRLATRKDPRLNGPKNGLPKLVLGNKVTYGGLLYSYYNYTLLGKRCLPNTTE